MVGLEEEAMRWAIGLALVLLGREVALGGMPTREDGKPLLTEEEAQRLRELWQGLDPLAPSPQEEAEAFKRAWRLLAEEVARMVADGWDQYGAPTVAKYQPSRYFGHYAGPKGEVVVEAESKREAYKSARKAWIRDLLE